jgi:hypothetical protein
MCYVRHTAIYWRARAGEARRIASHLNEEDKRRMVDVALLFDELARQEEQREFIARRVTKRESKQGSGLK